jgi:hypothetical protein
MAGTASGTVDDAQAIETLLRDYIRMWNGRETVSIWKKIYHFTPDGPYADEAAIRDMLARLEAEGFDYTELHAVEAKCVSPDEGEAVLTFSRILTDGTAMPPGRRKSGYKLRKFSEGWRVTDIYAIP